MLKHKYPLIQIKILKTNKMAQKPLNPIHQIMNSTRIKRIAIVHAFSSPFALRKRRRMVMNKIDLNLYELYYNVIYIFDNNRILS